MLIFNILTIAYCTGAIALLSTVLTLSPVISNAVHCQLRNNTTLPKISYWGAIATIFSALAHGLLMTQKASIDFYDLKTYWTYAEGLLTFNLLTIFAFNFNEIKYERKRFTYFIYAILFLVCCHLSATILI